LMARAGSQVKPNVSAKRTPRVTYAASQQR
jgi:hypothetical protein